MYALNDIGHEIHLVTPDETVLCVDAFGVIRGMYLAVSRQYFSAYECWCDTKGLGRVDSTSAHALTAHDLEGRVLTTPDGVPIWNLGVTAIRSVDLQTILSKKVIVGVDIQPRRPGLGEANDNQD